MANGNRYQFKTFRVYDILAKNADGTPAQVELFDENKQALAEAKAFAKSQGWGCVRPNSFTADDGMSIAKTVAVGFKDEATTPAQEVATTADGDDAPF